MAKKNDFIMEVKSENNFKRAKLFKPKLYGLMFG